jgi:Zn-dependent protease with chaperone function
MTTDFFDRQDHARRQTTRLIVMFALAVVAIILAIYLALALGAVWAEAPRHVIDDLSAEAQRPAVQAGRTLWNPALFLGVTLGTILVIGLGSLYKISELSGGGEHVALMLGGRVVHPQTTEPAERRLLNVVEEMALASGVPVPPVYVLDHEPGINAFAAGYQPGDAVVAVSAGCLRYLTREELQGVMGHEFSHIVNGDMRLNLRLVGIVFGILVLAVIGYYALRVAGQVGPRDRKSGGATATVFLVGLVLLVMGYLGVFLGKLIKCGISRQREFLADASSVQFTRNPGGITGALKKIGGQAAGSRIRDGHAAEISHMFFGDAFAGSLLNLFATHPPLERRIRALEPDFDGRFPVVRPLTTAEDAAAEPLRAGQPAFVASEIVTAAASPAVMALDAGDTAQRIGRPRAEHLSHAGRIVEGMPQPLLEAARQPFVAQAVIYALLLSRDDEATRTRQLQLLQGQIEPPLYKEVEQLAAMVQSLPVATRLSLVDLALPALKKSSPKQYGQLRQAVELLAHAEGKVDLYEYCLRTVLLSYLDVHFGLKKAPAVRYRTAGAVAGPAAVVLSTLAYVGQQQPEEVQRAFQAGAQGLLGQAAMVPRQQCTLRMFDASLAVLAQVSPNVKRQIISAVTATIAADGKVTAEESELLRAIAAVLACPLPPMAAATNGD